MKKDYNLSQVPVPKELDERQAKRARDYVEGTVIKGLTQTEFCKQYDVSSATLHSERHMKNPIWQKYVHMLMHECIGKDDIQDHELIMEKIKNNALKPNATKEDYNLYTKYYDWMIEYYKKTKLDELGVNKNADNRTVEERKASILSRLKG